MANEGNSQTSWIYSLKCIHQYVIDCDGIVFLSTPTYNNTPAALRNITDTLLEWDKQLDLKKPLSTYVNGPIVIPLNENSCRRLIYQSMVNSNPLIKTNMLSLYNQASSSMKKASSLKLKNLILIVDVDSWPGEKASDVKSLNMRYMLLNAMLGAYEATYVPLQVRSGLEEDKVKFKIFINEEDPVQDFDTKEKSDLVRLSEELGEGLEIARDICGSDSEYMTPSKIVDYIKAKFANTKIEITVDMVNQDKYPLTAAVNRAASQVNRHDGRIVTLSYKGDGQITDVLYLLGKGTTFDTGGVSIKTGIAPLGMSREKCGAAALVGFMKVLEKLQPEGLIVNASMTFVMNSIGADSYMPDEIIRSLSGKHVRVVNTDADGRLVMADLLWHAKEHALGYLKSAESANVGLFTWGSFSERASVSYGDHVVLMDNGPAKKVFTSEKLKYASELISDPAEIATLRREDFDACWDRSGSDQLLQLNTAIDSRHHSYPAAFMMLASGLERHGSDSGEPLAYTHVDTYGKMKSRLQGLPPSSPLLMFAARYILPRNPYKFDVHRNREASKKDDDYYLYNSN